MLHSENLISFIVPFKANRAEQLNGFVNNLDKYYSDYSDYEIIICEQCDGRPFLRGQLLNLGYKRSFGDPVVLIDVDMRFMETVDIIGVMKRNKKPYLPWYKLQEVDEDGGEMILLGETRESPSGWGGCNVWTREQFEKYGGFPNLLFGWGKEDNIMHARCDSNKLSFKMAHVRHERPIMEELPWLAHNRRMEVTDGSRRVVQDGFRHTIANEIECNVGGKVKHFKFENIWMSEDFGYFNLVPGELKL